MQIPYIFLFLYYQYFFDPESKITSNDILHIYIEMLLTFIFIYKYEQGSNDFEWKYAYSPSFLSRGGGG